MSGFAHYIAELAQLDHEIHHYAALCHVRLDDRAAIEACLHDPHDGWAADKARISLRGLLILRLKLEREMLEQGLNPPALSP